MLNTILFVGIAAAIGYLTYRVEALNKRINSVDERLNAIAVRLDQLIEMLTNGKVPARPNGPEQDWQGKGK